LQVTADRSARPLHPATATLLAALAYVVASVLAAALVLLSLQLARAAGLRDGEAPRPDSLPALMAMTVVQWPITCVALRALGRRFCAQDDRSSGLATTRRASLWARGLALGLALLLLPGLLAHACGLLGEPPAAVLAAVPAPSGVAAWPLLLATLPALFIAAFGEEYAFRGFLQPLWEPGAGPQGALLLAAALFTGLHVTNPGASFAGALGVFIAGLLLGLARGFSGSLWLPAGIHFGWNLAEGCVLGLPMSGFRLPSLLRWQSADGPVARRLAGGEFGPEEGLLFHSSLALGIALLLLLAPRLRAAASASPAPDAP
jgi:membrane protease YdiL (CAAX protease family)